jgi:hypothetical protein
MSRRSLLARGGVLEKSRVVITLAAGTTVLPLNLNGINIKITDKNNTVLYSAPAQASTNNLAIPAAPTDNQYTIEVGKVTTLYLNSGTSLQKVLEFKIKNQAAVRMNGCTNLTEVRNINVSAITSLSSLFDSCTNLTTIDPFTIKDGCNCSYMFRSTKISSIPVTNLKDASYVDNIFFGCTLLNDISVLHNIDLKWISIEDFVTNSGVSVIENLRFINLVNFIVKGTTNNVANITAIRNIYAPLVTRVSCTHLVNLVEFSNVTTGAITNLYQAFLNCSSLPAVPVLNASTTSLSCNRTFEGCTSLSNIDNFVTIYNNFTGSTIDCTQLFMNCTALVNVPITDFRKTNSFYVFKNTGITSLSNIITANAVGMFSDCQKLLTVTNANFQGSPQQTFYRCSKLTSVTATVASSGLSNMFSECSMLSSASITCTAPAATDLDFQSMFSRCSQLNPSTLTINTPNNNKYNATGMFGSCSHTNFTQPPSTLDYSRATSVQSMFFNCYYLTSTGNLTLTECVTASSMFNSCNNLANVGNISAPIATTCSSFFSSCDRALVTVAGTLSFPSCTDFAGMFSSCYLLNHIPAIDNTGATDFGYMFSGARSITVYNNNYNLSSATALQYMFYNCNELTSVTISDTFTTTDTGSSVINIAGMFATSLKLTDVVFADASKFITSTANNTFGSNTQVTNLVYPGFRTIMELPPLITDVAKIEAYINSAGTPRFGSNRIIQIGATRKASISQTVIDNAVAKGWTVT